jgi:ribosomal protein S18 acetylase RimI-like enzyme
MTDDLRITPLTPDRFDDLAELFGQGGDPRWCWCAYFRVRGMSWSNSTPEGNRAVLEAATETALAEGHSTGLVAYIEDNAVAWVSLGPRSDYERLAYSRVLAPVDDTPVWSIVCFVVGRRLRGQGVAGALLDAAIGYARDHGAVALEAYPVDTKDGRIRPAEAFKGTLSMFERAGFEVVERRRANRNSPERPIVRLSL